MHTTASTAGDVCGVSRLHRQLKQPQRGIIISQAATRVVEDRVQQSQIKKITHYSDDILLWARDFLNYKTDKCQEYSFKDGLRGVLALGNIHKGDVLIEAPLKQAFALRRNTKNPLEKEGVPKEYWKKAPWYNKLSLLILAEMWKEDQSKLSSLEVQVKDLVQNVGTALEFDHYINKLPTSFESLANWTDDELEHVRYPAARFLAEKQRQRYDNAFKNLTDSCPDLAVTENEFRWALNVVFTRSHTGKCPMYTFRERVYQMMRLVIIGGLTYVFHYDWAVDHSLWQVGIALFNVALIQDKFLPKVLYHAVVPGIDFVNHKAGYPQEIQFEYFRGQFELVAATDIPRFTQVYITYGEKGNDVLMQQYGFVETNNPVDEYVFGNFLDQLRARVEVDPKRIEVLEEGKYLDFVQCLSVSRDGKPKSEGLAALRYLLAPAADIPRTDPMDKFTKASKATKELDKLAFEVMLSIGREELMAWSAKPKSRFDMRDVESGETEGELSHTEAVNARKQKIRWGQLWDGEKHVVLQRVVKIWGKKVEGPTRVKPAEDSKNKGKMAGGKGKNPGKGAAKTIKGKPKPKSMRVA